MTNSCQVKDKHPPKPGASIKEGIAIKPKPGIVRLMFKTWKYATILGVVLLIVLGGVAVLGDTSVELEENRGIFGLYNASDYFSNSVQEINKLLNKENSKYVSNRAVNLFLEDKVDKNDDIQKINRRFDDLAHFVEYWAAERYQNARVLELPLVLYEEHTSSVVPETLTSKLLKHLKNRVSKFLSKHDLTHDSSVKELKWSRVKKLA